MLENIECQGSGKPLLFLPGMFAGSWAWDSTIELLPKDQFSMYCINNPLCEISSNLDELVNYVINIINILKLEDLTVIGNSYGSSIAIELARTRPDLVSNIVISGAPCKSVEGDFGKPSREIEWVKKLCRNIFYCERSCNDFIDSNNFNKLNGLFENKKTFIKLISLMRAASSVDSRVSFLNIKDVNVFGIWGSRDFITPVDDWFDVFEITGRDLIIIDNCGHSPMYENPNVFVEKLLDLFQLRNKKEEKLLCECS
ncbi:alpha/beta hydrolase [Vibrio mimicus]|uniref:alpha/beta fold hydrolase n=1 Tax=Vibrio mimicus TaxID=674 RepID=UPI001A2E0060|nr:alpha/beta hydrolase [Vibrio cholerae]